MASRRLSDSPAWRPMWIMWVIGLATSNPINILTHTAWGVFCLLPYGALWAQVFIRRYVRRNDDE